MSDQFQWWRDALAGKKVEFHEGDPQAGYYRMRKGKGGPWVPIAIWFDDDRQLLAVDQNGERDALAVWTYCCRNPVSYEAWKAVAEDGASWPDDIKEPSRTANADALTQIAETIEALAREAARDLDSAPLDTDADARTRAANYATRLTELAAEADKEREREKRPHLEAGRQIDARWKPVIERGKAEARALKDAVGEALKTIKANAEKAGIDVLTKAGSRGKSVSLRTRKEAVCTDRDALFDHYQNDERFRKDAAVLRVLLSLAETDLQSGRTVNGASIVTKEYAA